MRKERYWSSGGKSSSSSKRSREEQQKKVCNSSNGGSTNTTLGGCMSAMFQIFDFHLSSHHNQSVSFRSTSSTVVADDDEPKKTTGTDAPKNSLEVDESPLSSSSSASSNPKIEDSLSLKMCIQIKTKSDRRDSVGSEVSSSPGTRTPTLVARLMGLDLLPDSTSSSPRPSSTSSHLLRGRKSCSDMESVGSRSVPETKKMSLSRRSDVGHYCRSDINKEDIDEEGLSPGHYARQIVKQVKETVSRRSGMSDITNNIVRRDQSVIANQLKNKQPSPEMDNGSSPSCSPRIRFLETHRKNSKPPPVQQYTKAVAADDEVGQRFSRRSTRADAEVVIRNRLQEETYVRPSPAARVGSAVTDKRCKKATPLSSGMRSIGGGGGGVPTVLPIKKDPSPTATKIPVKSHDAPQSKTHSGDRLIPTTLSSIPTAKSAELQTLSSYQKNFDLRVSPIRKYPQYSHVALGLQLVNEVNVLDDIDPIISIDLLQCAMTATSPAVEKEGGDMVVEIERHIWNGLMQELAAR